MTDPSLTHIVAILDRSGSMASIREDMEGGFNEFIAKQRETDGACLVTLVRFDDQYDVVYTDKPIADVPPLELEPRGWTALLDAMGRTIITTGAKLAALPEDQRPGLVVVLVVTDGQENHSREYTLDQINALVKQHRDQWNWMFVYLGANQDAIQVATSMGMNTNSAVTYRGGPGGQSAYVASGEMVTNTRRKVGGGMSTSAAVASAGYTDKDRENALNDEVDEAKK